MVTNLRFIGYVVTFLFFAFESISQSTNFSYSTPLIAARSHVIGEVQVDRDGDSLDVTYVVTDNNWSMTKTYLHVAGSEPAIPQTIDGVPDIQNFDYQTNHNNATIYKYDNIDVSALTYVYVSANANVTEDVSCVVDTAMINAAVPTGNLFMVLTITNNPSYFNMYLYDFNGDPIYSDYFYGNCVDLENPILEGYYYYPRAVSSYSGNTTLLECIIDKPENLDIINYLINYDYAAAIGAGGKEVQAAIWTIIDNDLPVNGTNGVYWNQAKVNYIVADATAKGEGYIPECGGYFAVLLDQGCKTAIQNNILPNINVQQSIFWLPVSNYPNSYNYSYGQCANAWGKGERFSFNGWGQYFQPK